MYRPSASSPSRHTHWSTSKARGSAQAASRASAMRSNCANNSTRDSSAAWAAVRTSLIAAGPGTTVQVMAMSTSVRRAPRWSKKTDQLVHHVALRCRPGFQSELGRWLEHSPRFSAFITTNQDKVRKKLSTPDDEQHRLDVRAELLVASLILADRRFELSFEAYGARRLGPDLTVTFRANQRFNLEVTRLRTTGDAGDDKLANVISGKLRQLPGEIPSALVIAARGLPLTEDSLVAAVRLLKTHTDGKDDAFFARRGFKDARDFYAQYLHLGGIFVLDEATDPTRAIFSPNREARQPLAKEVLSALMHCLTASHGPESSAQSRSQTRATVAASAMPSK